MPDRMPTLFVSHGAPSLLVDQDPTCEFFKRLGGILPRPKPSCANSATTLWTPVRRRMQ